MSVASATKTDSTATVGKSVVIKGQIVSQEDLVILGEVEGTIEIPEHRLTVALEGRVRADVIVRELEVIGSMDGNIEVAEKVHVRNGANVVGDIHSAGIIIEDGAQIKGAIALSRAFDRQSSVVEANSEIQELSHAVSIP
jgi:cytoskeletal protein CcmA (bactofilin family)